MCATASITHRQVSYCYCYCQHDSSSCVLLLLLLVLPAPLSAASLFAVGPAYSATNQPANQLTNQPTNHVKANHQLRYLCVAVIVCVCVCVCLCCRWAECWGGCSNCCLGLCCLHPPHGSAALQAAPTTPPIRVVGSRHKGSSRLEPKYPIWGKQQSSVSAAGRR